jgi:ABC-2 type transport system permease protein
MTETLAHRPSLLQRVSNKTYVCWALLVVNARNRRGSYSDLFFSGLTLFLRISIYSAMYRVAFGAEDTAAFITAVWAVTVAQAMFSMDRPDPTLTIGEDIKEGTIAVHLLRPLNYVQYSVASFWGRSIPAVVANSVFAIAAALVWTRELPETLGHIALCIIPILLGMAVITLIATLLGVFGFWTEDTNSFNYISHKMALLFGGIIIPLSLLPQEVQDIVSFIPWTVGLARPGKLVSEFDSSYYINTISLQIFYIVVLYIAAVVLMNRGIKKLNVSGG